MTSPPSDLTGVPAARLASRLARYRAQLGAAPDHPQAVRLRALATAHAAELDRRRAAPTAPAAAPDRLLARVETLVTATRAATARLAALPRSPADTAAPDPDKVMRDRLEGAISQYRRSLRSIQEFGREATTPPRPAGAAIVVPADVLERSSDGGAA